MKEWFKEFFTFNRNEQRGMVILLALMLLSVGFRFVLPLLIIEDLYDDESFRLQVEQFLKDTVASAEKYNKSGTGNIPVSPNGPGTIFIPDPFFFDPNEMDETRWRKTGLDERVIRNILRYRAKGGVFRSKDDLRKIYGMADSCFEILEPYIQIKPVESLKDTNVNRAKKYPDYKPPAYQPSEVKFTGTLDLNSADSAQLESLPGIGPGFASRIIRYREKLGGYVAVDQLLEIKGMDSARVSGLKERMEVDRSKVQQMDLNHVAFKEMLKHPYFEYYLVKAIFNRKDRIRSYDSVAQIRDLENMYPELYDKISPYLKVTKPEKKDQE